MKAVSSRRPTVYANTVIQVPGGPVLRYSTPGVSIPNKAEKLERLRSELGWASALGRKGIGPRVLSAGIHPERVALILVMERFGRSLSEYLREIGQVRADLARVIATQVAELICRSAALGLFLADIKPGNILVNEAGQEDEPLALLIDFDPKFCSSRAKDAFLVQHFKAREIAGIYAISMLYILFLHLNLDKPHLSVSRCRPYFDRVLRGFFATSAVPLSRLLMLIEEMLKDTDDSFSHGPALFRQIAWAVRHYNLFGRDHRETGDRKSVV